MLKAIKKLITSGALAGLLFSPMLMPAVAHAAPANLTGANTLACGSQGDLTNVNCTVGNTAVATVNNITTIAINLFSVVVGLVCVVMIIIGGLKYVTSNGDTGNVSGAKNTILYAVVGLVIVALAQLIVKFVVNKTAVAGG